MSLIIDNITTEGNLSGNTLFVTNAITSAFSADTIAIISTPTNSNSNTQILTRNSTTGDIEYSTAASSTFYPYGIGFAQSIGNYLT